MLTSDSHGVSITEKEPKEEYGENGRGVGYIQVTYVETHEEAYEYLIGNGYITDDNPELSVENGYVDALAQNPWAVSAWYWAYFKKVKKGNDYIPLNECVVNVIHSPDYKDITMGLPYVCEAFVIGMASGGTTNDIHHKLARGEGTWEIKTENDHNYIYNKADETEKTELISRADFFLDNDEYLKFVKTN